MASRQLKPEYSLNGCGFNFCNKNNTKLNLDEDTTSLDEEIEKSHRELGEALEQQRKERWDYLIEIDRMQNVRENLPWPYDLCKMAGDSEETLQWAREHDHHYEYVRDYPKYEYNPNNYLNIKKLPKYDYRDDTYSQETHHEIFYNFYDNEYLDDHYDSDSDQESLPDYSNFKSFINDYGKDINDNEGWTLVSKK